MPININPSETHDEFISRCMSVEQSSFPNEDQRYAVCESYWRQGKGLNLTNEERVLRKINAIPFSSEEDI